VEQNKRSNYSNEEA